MTAFARPVIGVMGSGTDRHEALATPLGRWIAEQGYHLLTGAGGGVMAAVAEAFVSVERRAGLSIGVVPGRVDEGGYHAPEGYPSRWVELAIHTHLPLSGELGRDPMSRNHINVLTATVVVVLPGRAGTRSEAELAVEYGRPVVLHGPPTAFEGFPDVIPRARTLDAVARFVTSQLGPAVDMP